MKRQDLKRRDIQAKFREIGYRANFVSNPLNKQIVTIEFATDTQPPMWIQRASWNEQPTANTSCVAWRVSYRARNGFESIQNSLTRTWCNWG